MEKDTLQRELDSLKDAKDHEREILEDENDERASWLREQVEKHKFQADSLKKELSSLK